jgi:hypothetical protein
MEGLATYKLNLLLASYNNFDEFPSGFRLTIKKKRWVLFEIRTTAKIANPVSTITLPGAASIRIDKNRPVEPRRGYPSCLDKSPSIGEVPALRTPRSNI